MSRATPGRRRVLLVDLGSRGHVPGGLVVGEADEAPRAVVLEALHHPEQHLDARRRLPGGVGPGPVGEKAALEVVGHRAEVVALALAQGEVRGRRIDAGRRGARDDAASWIEWHALRLVARCQRREPARRTFAGWRRIAARQRADFAGMRRPPLHALTLVARRSRCSRARPRSGGIQADDRRPEAGDARREGPAKAKRRRGSPPSSSAALRRSSRTTASSSSGRSRRSTAAVARAKALGIDTIRITAGWSSLTRAADQPTKPAGFDAARPRLLRAGALDGARHRDPRDPRAAG